VPEAITAFLESDSFFGAIQIAISIGGDSDTIACITGSIAEAFYKNIPISLAWIITMQEGSIWILVFDEFKDGSTYDFLLYFYRLKKMEYNTSNQNFRHLHKL
jgi:hypothetical protein